MSAAEVSDSGIATVTFGLFPGRTLRISLHENVREEEAMGISLRAAGHHPAAAEAAGPSARGRFAVMDASRVASLRHLGVAANMAMARMVQWEAKEAEAAMAAAAAAVAGAEADADAGSEARGQGTGDAGKDAAPARRRGIGLETVLCAAGTSHTGSALWDYAFQPGADDGRKGKGAAIKATGPRTVLALGFDCGSDSEYGSFLSEIGLIGESRASNLLTYLKRERTPDELRHIMKSYKVSKNEVDMSSLEDAIITRVATKFTV